MPKPLSTYQTIVADKLADRVAEAALDAIHVVREDYKRSGNATEVFGAAFNRVATAAAGEAVRKLYIQRIHEYGLEPD